MESWSHGAWSQGSGVGSWGPGPGVAEWRPISLPRNSFAALPAL